MRWLLGALMLAVVVTVGTLVATATENLAPAVSQEQEQEQSTGLSMKLRQPANILGTPIPKPEWCSAPWILVRDPYFASGIAVGGGLAVACATDTMVTYLGVAEKLFGCSVHTPEGRYIVPVPETVLTRDRLRYGLVARMLAREGTFQRLPEWWFDAPELPPDVPQRPGAKITPGTNSQPLAPPSPDYSTECYMFQFAALLDTVEVQHHPLFQ